MRDAVLDPARLVRHGGEHSRAVRLTLTVEKLTEDERLDLLDNLTRIGAGDGIAYDWFLVNEDDYVPIMGTIEELTPRRVGRALNEANSTEGFALYLTPRAMQKLEAEPSEPDPNLPSNLPFAGVPIRLLWDASCANAKVDA